MTTARQLAQQAQQRFTALVLEIDADYCNNTYGLSSCTAGRIVSAHTAQAGAAQSLTLAATESSAVDSYKNYRADITSGPGSGQSRNVVGSIENWITYSQDFSNAAWYAISLTVTPNNFTAPDGTLTASELVFGAVGSSRIEQRTSLVAVNGSKYVGSIWIYSSVATSKLSLQVVALPTNVGAELQVNLSVGWNRVFNAMTLAGSNPGDTMFLHLINRDGTGGTFYGWGAQLETGSLPSGYVRTLATPAVGAIIDTPWTVIPDWTSVYNIVDPYQCYNTFGTCKSKPNYAKGVKTFSFCNRGMQIPAGQPWRPYITNHAFTPTEIPVAGGLAMRGQTTLTLADETGSDVEADKYAATRSASGSFWTRFLARNYNIQGRFARVRKGYMTTPFDWAVFQTELYTIYSITGPDSSGNISVVLNDATKTLDQNMLPVATNGKLAADLKATAYSGTLVAAAATTATLDAKASSVDGTYVGMELYITQNTGSGQRAVITAYVGATRIATVAAWAVVPDNTSTYQIGALNLNVGTGLGAQYADPVATGLPQYVRIGQEVVRYTAIAGDVLSWPDTSYRAQFGTAAADAKAGDGVQLCFAPVGKSVTDTLHRLINAAGLADAYIDLAGLATEDADWYGAAVTLTACIHTPTKASALLDELLGDLDMLSWWDAVAQQIKLKANMPQVSSSVVAITPNETISQSMQVTPLDSLRITRSYLAFAPFSATDNMTQSTSFADIDGYIDANAESPNEYNNIISEQKYSRWLSSANTSFAANKVARRISRFRDPPFKMAFSLDPRNEVRLGDLIEVSSRRKTDPTGAPAVTLMRVTKLLDNQNFDIEALSTNFKKRYGFIQPPGGPDYAAASDAQRNYAYIANAATGLMSDGSEPFLII